MSPRSTIDRKKAVDRARGALHNANTGTRATYPCTPGDGAGWAGARLGEARSSRYPCRMRLRDRVNAVTGRQLLLAAAVLVPLAGGAAVLGATTEDVTQHNGLSTTDPAHLRFFVDHRPAALVDVARQVTNVGAAPVLAAVAVVAAAALWWRGQRVVVAIAPGIALGVAA